MFKIFVTVDKHQGFKSLTVKWHLSGLNIRPANLKIRLLIISKFLTISSNCRLRSSARQHSIVQLLIWNEMNSDANVAAHLSTGTNAIGKQNLTGFISFFSSRPMWWITNDMLVISVVEKYFRLGLTHLIPLKKKFFTVLICIHSLLQHFHS